MEDVLLYSGGNSSLVPCAFFLHIPLSVLVGYTNMSGSVSQVIFLILSIFFERDTQGHGAKERHCRLTVRFLLEKCVWVVDLCSIFYHITI
jgi:hypothetical protein